MNLPRARSAPATPPVVVAAAAAFALLLLVWLPASLWPGDRDEFAYLKSVVQTLQHGRPWTDDYLEPWAAALSGFTALLFQITGSMTLAAHGLIVIAGALSCAGFARLLQARGLSPRQTGLLTALIMSCPFVLRRSLEFSDLILYLPCLSWALWAAEKRRWTVFLLVWAVAVANRQSAIAWLALPALACLRAGPTRPVDPSAWRAPALAVGIGLVWFATLSLGMNLTDAQLSRTFGTLAQLQSGTFKTFLSAALFGFIAMGLGSLVVAWTRGDRGLRPTWTPRTRWLVPLLAAAWLLLDPRDLVMVDSRYDFLNGVMGWLYAKTVVLLAAAGWLLGRATLRKDLAICALLSAGLMALRQVVFDRYLFDLALFSFFAVVPVHPRAGDQDISATPASLRCRRVIGGAAALLFTLHVIFAVRLKINLDETVAWSRLHEQALREGRIRPTELLHAPAAYRGWYLFSHSIAHPLPGGRKAAGYVRFTEDTVQASRESPPWMRRVLPDVSGQPPASEQILAETRARVGWFWHARYLLARQPATRPGGVLGSDYRPVPFPMTSAEWRQLIDGPALR